jgi:hypothetical protein
MYLEVCFTFYARVCKAAARAVESVHCTTERLWYVLQSQTSHMRKDEKLFREGKR